MEGESWSGPGQVWSKLGSGYSSNLILQSLTLKKEDLFLNFLLIPIACYFSQDAWSKEQVSRVYRQQHKFILSHFTFHLYFSNSFDFINTDRVIFLNVNLEYGYQACFRAVEVSKWFNVLPRLAANYFQVLKKPLGTPIVTN